MATDNKPANFDQEYVDLLMRWADLSKMKPNQLNNSVKLVKNMLTDIEREMPASDIIAHTKYTFKN